LEKIARDFFDAAPGFSAAKRAVFCRLPRSVAAPGQIKEA